MTLPPSAHMLGKWVSFPKDTLLNSVQLEVEKGKIALKLPSGFPLPCSHLRAKLATVSLTANKAGAWGSLCPEVLEGEMVKPG